MCHVRLRGCLAVIVIYVMFALRAAHAEIISVPFTAGFAGAIGSNSGQANAIKNFATLGIVKASFMQTTTSGQFGGTQGNDLSGTLRLVFTNGQTVDIPGAVNWRITQGATLHYFGFIPAPGVAPYVITYGSNQQYTLNASSNYGLRKIGSTQSFADGANVSGNASVSGLVSALNTYLADVQASGPKITGPSGTSGAAVSALTVNENQTGVATMTADRAVSWAVLGGTDAGKFAINVTTGVLTFLTAPDFELPADSDTNNSYVVQVQATDSGGFTAQQTVTVTVANLDDTPPVITGLQAVLVAEGQTAVTGLVADESVVWAISGGVDAASFAVNASGVVRFVAAPNFAAPGDVGGDNVYIVTVSATDSAGNTSLQPLTVTVTKVIAGDVTPPVVTGPAGGVVSLAEGQLAAAAYSANEPVVWSIGGADAAAFTVDATGRLSFLAAPVNAAPSDADGNNIYLLTVTATDSAGNSAMQTLSVTITDATPPVVTGPAGGVVSLAEGQLAVAVYAANEPVVWAITGADAAAFTVDAAGAVTFATAPDYAAPGDANGDNIYLLTVTATDSAGNITQQSLSVTVMAAVVPDTTPPVITGPSGGAASVTEGQTAVAVFTANEPVVWSIGGADAAVFIVDATGAVTFVTAPNYTAPGDANGDNIYLLTVTATDSAGNITQQPLSVTVMSAAVPDTTPPVITGPAGGAASVTEGQTAVAVFTANEPVVWAITGADAAAFIVDAAGAVTFATAPDYAAPGDANGDNIYLLTVTATDSAGNVGTVSLAVSVIAAVRADVTPPVITGPSGIGSAQAITVTEGQLVVTTFTSDEVVVWSIAGTDAGDFAIDPLTGAVRFVVRPVHDAPADSDGNNIYSVTVIANDPAGNHSQQPLTVAVTATIAGDVAAPIITGPSGLGAAQTATVGDGQMAVATLTADEPVTWAIGGPDAQAFVIDPGTGLITFSRLPTANPPGDVDGDNVYLIRVVGTDAAGNIAEVTLSITVAAVIPPDITPPMIVGPSGNPGATQATLRMAEGLSAVTRLFADEAVVWSVTGGPDAAVFIIDRATGALTFAQVPDFDMPADAQAQNTYAVVLSATDSTGNTSTITLTIIITDVVEPDTTSPTILGPGDQRYSLREGQTFIVTLRASERVTWAIAGGADGAALIIDAVSGAVQFARAPDFDVPGDANGDNSYVVRIIATDAAGNAGTVTLTVTVLDLDDAATGIYDSYSDDVTQIVNEVAANHLQSAVTSLQAMATAARDRFIAARRMTARCSAAQDAALSNDAACSLVSTRNTVPFRVHGQAHIGASSSSAAGTFFGQTGDFAGTRRRIVSGDFSIVDNGVGVATSDMTARIAWERRVSDRVMLGYFVGGSFGQSTINRRLRGRADQVSLSMGTYFVAALRDTLQLDGFVALGASRNMLGLRDDDVQLDGTYAAQSLLMGLALSGEIDADGYQLRPEISVAWGATHIGAGHFNATAAGTTETATALSRSVDFAKLRITPELRIPVDITSAVANFIAAPSLMCGWTNGARACSGGLMLGLQGTSWDHRTQFDITLNADRIGGKDRVAMRANIEHRF